MLEINTFKLRFKEEFLVPNNSKFGLFFRGKYFYKKVKIVPSKFCNNAKFFPRPKDPKVQKSSNVEKVFTENI